MSRSLVYWAAFVALAGMGWMTNVGAVPNPSAIQWSAQPEVLVSSLYVGVLGRLPQSQADWDNVSALGAAIARGDVSRYKAFRQFIESPEYQSSQWAKLPGEYTIWWDTRVAEWPNGSEYLCHCYHFGKFGVGFMPSLQFTGIEFPAGKMSLGYAAAMTALYWYSDRESCPHYDCGYPLPAEGAQFDDHRSVGNELGDADACRERYCPGCAGALNLFNESLDPSCGDCLVSNMALINQCSSGIMQPPAASSPWVGSWRWFNGGTADIQADGTVTTSGSNYGTWRADGDTVVISWHNGGYIDRLQLSADGHHLEGRNQHGTRVWADRTNDGAKDCERVCLRSEVKYHNKTDGRHGLCANGEGRVWSGAIYVECVRVENCLEWGTRCR